MQKALYIYRTVNYTAPLDLHYSFNDTPGAVLGMKGVSVAENTQIVGQEL